MPFGEKVREETIMTRQPRRWQENFVVFGLGFIFFLASISGCGGMASTGTNEEESETPIVTIREFPDVPIPQELKLDEKESFVYMTPNLATGLLVYNGKANYDVLVRFFEENLTKEGWVLRASLKYPRNFFFYQKESSVCLITMDIKARDVHLEIWVAPLEQPPYEYPGIQ
jgi:hypothetical protein